ncbi:MAG: class I SAM-dependent methyltransferase [Candidatus Competibacterales bacterium]
MNASISNAPARASFVPLDTPWVRRVRRGERPSAAELQEHLLAVHRHHAGFTESCAGRCRDAQGRNSYQWLAEAVDPHCHRRVLDLACGSGPLTAWCRQRFGAAVALTGVDMSPEELALARLRIPDPDVVLHCGLAQQLDFLDDASVDAVLCHWALTLMDPVEPVLAEVRRVLGEGGIFAAIVDGERTSAPGYDELHHLIYGWVQREYPGYGTIDLGDVRVRTTAELTALVVETFPTAAVRVEPGVVYLEAPSEVLAREAVGFFYAAFVLSAEAHRQMLAEVENWFIRRGLVEGRGRFAMPINRLVVAPRP